MSGFLDRLGKGIRAFVDNPTTNLVKGLSLLIIGVSDASHTFRNDLTSGHVRVGHGLIIIGIFSMLDALPHFIESMEAGARFMELREQKHRTGRDADKS